jgi:monoamine oxidase
VQPFAARVAVDAKSLGDKVATPAAHSLDQLSLAEYLDRAGLSGWMRQFFEVAYVTEYGLDAGEQSCLNLVTLLATAENPQHFEPYGTSDERYKIAGGNQRLTDAMAQSLAMQLRMEHRLEAVRERGPGFSLTFAQRNGSVVDVDADAVILALPFTLLRQVDLQVAISPTKRLAIETLGYGTGAKLLLGFATRPWRDQRLSGGAWSDEPFQSCWEHTRLQAGTHGGLTVFGGGRAGLALGEGGDEADAQRLMPGLDRTFPGLAVHRIERVASYRWPTSPLALGSYACYRPGQWTGFAGIEGEAEGNLFFAGEHCSRDYQGYMNGAAETGRRATAAILARVGQMR